MNTDEINKAGRIRTFFRKHPVLLLLLLSPGIVEYLSSSSPVSALFLNPFLFLIQLVANLGLYGPGVLLIREALVRWKKGWATAIALGVAYGILEEGIALSTMFNPNSSVVQGVLGSYGWWHRVNWIWSPTAMILHAVFSITLPLLLFELALPERKGQPLLGKRSGISVAGILLVDVLFLLRVTAHVEHFFLGIPTLLASIIVIAACVLLGYLLPATAFSPRSAYPKTKPWVMIPVGMYGILFFIMAAIGKALNLPIYLTLLAIFLLVGSFLAMVMQWIGKAHNQRHLIALTIGLLLPLVIAGILNELPFPVVLVLDLLFTWFLIRLWKDAPPSADTLLKPA